MKINIIKPLFLVVSGLYIDYDEYCIYYTEVGVIAIACADYLVLYFNIMSWWFYNGTALYDAFIV